jgi:arabinogalactan endo-1,4-beta-galactosidase
MPDLNFRSRVVAAALLALYASRSLQAQSVNLIENPSFESSSIFPWRLKNESSEMALTETDSVEGKQALILRPGARVSQRISLTAGVYELHGFVRPAVGQVMQLELACARWQTRDSTDMPDPSSPLAPPQPTPNWQELRVPPVFLKSTYSCLVSIQVKGSGTEASLLDSIALTRHENQLVNPLLADRLKGWRAQGISGTSHGSVLFEGGHRGVSDASLFQTVRLRPGTYTLAASYRSSGGQPLARLEANNCGPRMPVLNLAPASFGDQFRRVKLRGIEVTNAECEIGIHVKSSASQWLRVRNITLESEPHPYRMILGGDATLTDMVEEHGGLYKLGEVADDPFDILAKCGMNLTRLHVFVDPGNLKFSPSRRMRGSYADLAHVLRLAKRAQTVGMKIELSLHLSDYWADGGCQTMPHSWLGLKKDELVDAVRDYVISVLSRFGEEQISVEIVAIGNEADLGLLRTAECDSPLLAVNSDAVTNADLLARIYDTTYRAVHEISPQTGVVWHLANIGRYAETRAYLDAMLRRGAHPDIISYSAYPFWSRQTIRQFADFGAYVAERYRLPVFFEETGYPWTPAADADNMKDGGPEPYTLSPRGQLDFLNDEISAIESADDGRIIGFSYWDATWIATPGSFDNVENYVLFDRAGRALPALTCGFGAGTQ